MIEKSVIYKFVSFFDGAESVALLCHVNPDSDTLGSAKNLGKEATCIATTTRPKD